MFDVMLHFIIVLGQVIDLVQCSFETLVNVFLKRGEQKFFFLLLFLLRFIFRTELVQNLVLYSSLFVSVILFTDFLFDFLLFLLLIFILEASQVLFCLSIYLLFLKCRWWLLGIVHS